MNWYKKAQNIESIENKWKQLGVVLYIFEQDDVIILDSLIVPHGQRKQGIGTQIMQELASYADQVGKRLEVSPGQKDDYHGTTSRGRLVNFYKRFGLIENKGRNKDFSISKSMYRNPE
jgi:predicted GNAT family acetyltransferase